MSRRLEGKVALVTGAARGIGFETAKLLHARGCSVVIVDLDPAAAEAAAASIARDRVVGVGGDVVSLEAMERAVSVAVERFGGLDVVVANAGLAPPTATVRAIDPRAFDRTLDVDLHGVWRTVRAALPQIVERQGHVVVVSSIYAWANGALNASYAAAKAGVEALGRTLRIELAPHGASATVAHFGFIDTKMVQHALEDDVAERAKEKLPGFMAKSLPPSAAAAGVVRAVEGRKPRLILPRWWYLFYWARGVLGPLLDRAMLRDAELQAAVRDGDAAERGQLRGGLDRTAGSE